MNKSENAAREARARWDSIAKPLGSLGALEDLITKICALTQDSRIDIRRRCVAIVCADNGVVEEGVTSSPAEVTQVIAHNIAQGTSSVCRMCAPHGIDCVAVDVGMKKPVSDASILNRRVAAGTANIVTGPAMTREQAQAAIQVGIQLVDDLKSMGYCLVATGEMGIGNTTTATAMTCAFLDVDPARITGRGAGLSDEGLERKTQVITRALQTNKVDASDPLDVLSKLGGLDIAAMCGMFLGGARHRVPVVMDGVISAVAAYCAMQLQPDCADAILPSHLSAEPAMSLLLERMGMQPVIHANMRLGEGTGAACLIPLLDMAVSLYQTGPTYDDCGIEAFVDENETEVKLETGVAQ